MATTRTQAEAAYTSHHARAQEALARIAEALEDMPAPEGETRITWSHAESQLLAQRLSRDDNP